MFKSRQHLLVGFLMLASLLGLSACTGSVSSGNTLSLEGVLGKIDSISGDVTVILNDGSTVEFNLKDVTVENIRETSGDVSLEMGNVVSINRGQNGKVTDLKVNAAEIEGIIKTVDAKQKKIIITLDTKEQLTLNVTGTTSIAFTNNETVSLGQLVQGQMVNIIYEVRSKNALKIRINQENDKIKTLQGKIASIDAQAKTVTVQYVTGLGSLTLQVTPLTKIFVNRVSTFESLFIGMDVKIKFNPDTNELLKINGKDLRAPIEKFLEKNQ